MTWSENSEGVLLPIKVIPKTNEKKIVGWESGRLKIKVSAPPEKGAANRAVVHLLSKYFNIPQRDIVLLKGETSRQKEFLLAGRTIQEFQAII